MSSFGPALGRHSYEEAVHLLTQDFAVEILMDVEDGPYLFAAVAMIVQHLHIVNIFD